jgi:hypothetical protein
MQKKKHCARNSKGNTNKMGFQFKN